jgi:hypothetical protein
MAGERRVGPSIWIGRYYIQMATENKRPLSLVCGISCPANGKVGPGSMGSDDFGF